MLPCAFVARMLGEKEIPAYVNAPYIPERNAYDVKTIQPYHCAIQTQNLNNADDAIMVEEFEKLNKKIEYLINKAKKRGHEIRDVKFLWRNINTAEGPDKFVRVLMRSCDPAYPVYETNIK